MFIVGEILSPRFKITASAWSFDVALEGRSTGTGGSFGFNTFRQIGQKICGFVLNYIVNLRKVKSST